MAAKFSKSAAKSAKFSVGPAGKVPSQRPKKGKTGYGNNPAKNAWRSYTGGGGGYNSHHTASDIPD